LPENIRRGSVRLSTVTDTLAYCNSKLITVVESFRVEANAGTEKLTLKVGWSFKGQCGSHNIQHKGCKHNDTQHKDCKHNSIQHKDSTYNGIQHKGSTYDDTQHKDSRHNDTQCINIIFAMTEAVFLVMCDPSVNEL
jgi:hypothetical protein